MMTSRVAWAAMNPVAVTPVDPERNTKRHLQPLVNSTRFHELARARRSESRPAPITIREIAVVIGLVAIGLRVLPHPLNVLTAFVLPPVYFLNRIYPSMLRPIGLLGYLASVGISFLPAWITGESSDFTLGMIALLVIVIGIFWLETWRYPGLWDILDRLFFACNVCAAPIISS